MKNKKVFALVVFIMSLFVLITVIAVSTFQDNFLTLGLYIKYLCPVIFVIAVVVGFCALLQLY